MAAKKSKQNAWSIVAYVLLAIIIAFAAYTLTCTVYSIVTHTGWVDNFTTCCTLLSGTTPAPDTTITTE